ncbi:MAG: hypothetical protein ACKVXR_03265 [Planctomycetota bacterium]
MTDTPSTPPPRKPFAGMPEPEPFYRTPEFQRFVGLLGVFAIVGLIAFYFFSVQKKKVAVEQAATAREATLPKLLSPEDAEARATKLSTLLEGSLSDTQNGTDFVETTGYRKLLQIVASYPAEEVERRAVRKLDYGAAMADPDAWRGEFVWRRGIVLNLYAERLRDPVFGMTDVYRGILAEADGEMGVFFDLPGAPPEFELRRDPVDVYGIFYRTVRYEPLSPQVKENLVRTVPYLVVRSIRKVEDAKADPTGFLGNPLVVTIVGAGLVLFLMRLLIYLFQRRRRRSRAPALGREAGFREMFEKKLRQEKRTEGPRSRP